MFDVTRLSTFESVQWWKAILDSESRLPNRKPIPVVLLANKVRERDRERERVCLHSIYPPLIYSVIEQMKASSETSTSLIIIVERRVSLRGLRHQQKRILELMKLHVV